MFYYLIAFKIVYILELEEVLDKFIRSETTKFYDEPAAEIIDKFQKDEISVDDLIDKWEKSYIEVFNMFLFATDLTLCVLGMITCVG